ncbi:25S rRNA (adenine645-N1)-methyltransferase [Imshaugia aleurites]|uniref:Ribosomal RNA-processing protein 8 n=1 Tax=Imshaugia aleurites TaxID=172621 RepID=A0A8H3G1Z9_9LECA|nr:25S rRNA (adenine645-N1)-methyltransferase [Imshaugia aleurites]
MFAVPGWSVSADTLKAQTEPKASKNATEYKPVQPNGTDKKRSRKRKRGHGPSNAVEITEENLGDLWRKHIEEKSSGQSRLKKEGKKVKHSKDGENDALGKVEDIDGGSFEGFSEEGKVAGTGEEAVPPKKRKKRRKEDKSAGTLKANGREDAAEASPPRLIEQGEAKNGKSRYEQRKAKASKKREQRALLQANGTLPPIRPKAVSSHASENAPAKPTRTAKPSESSKAPDTLQDPTVTKPGKLSKTPEPPKPSRAPDNTKAPAPSLPYTKLTPLQERMAAKLTSARFRHLNQTLYTSPSDQAMRLFADSPQNYTSYHAGFRAQVAVWPQNPVEGFIEDIKARSRVSVPSQKKLWREQKKGKKPKGSDGDATAGATTIPGGEKSDPLPRSRNGICTVVDLGCGDATLAASLSPSAKSLGLKFLSFDLAKGDTPHAHLVTVADISKVSAVGVRDGTVDIAICCLSLMGTNWVDVVGECARIVRAGGEVWVAEIKSRFARPGVNKKNAGGGIGRKKSVGRGQNAVGEEDYEAVALEEMEDVKIKGGKDETDVGAFVEVFGKRGLVLTGEPDMANKMFVRMRFVRSLVARVEKGDEERAARGRNENMGRSKMYAKTKFVDDDVEEVDESKVLKPCVYKTR